jgi:hypothetical protein
VITTGVGDDQNARTLITGLTALAGQLIWAGEKYSPIPPAAIQRRGVFGLRCSEGRGGRRMRPNRRLQPASVAAIMSRGGS